METKLSPRTGARRQRLAPVQAGAGWQRLGPERGAAHRRVRPLGGASSMLAPIPALARLVELVQALYGGTRT